VFGRERYTVTIRVVANTAQPTATTVAGAQVSVNGEAIGTTAEDGTISYSTSTTTALNVGVAKKFFVKQTYASAIDPLNDDGTVLDLELPPYVFVADTNNDRILRFSGMTDDAPVSVSGIGSSYYTFRQPSALTVDYDNGYLYVSDDFSSGSGPILIRISEFPDENGEEIPPEATRFLTDTAPTIGPTAIDWGQTTQPYVFSQLSVSNDGRGIYAVDPNETSDALSKLAYFDEAGSRWGGIVYQPDSSSVNEPAFRGIAQLPDGKIVYVYAGGIPTVDPVAYIAIADDISSINAGDPTAFAATIDLYGSSEGQLTYPTTIHVSADGSAVYVSDTGQYLGGSGVGGNHRIVRFNSDGTYDAGSYGYGSPYVEDGPGDTPQAGEFYYPVIIGVLPDNRIYIMNNLGLYEGGQTTYDDTLVRIDDIDGNGWSEISGWGAGETFNFEYYDYEYDPS